MDENPVATNDEQARSLTLLVYILQALGFFSGGLTWIAGAIVNHLKQDSLRGSWCASHFLWQMRTFWYALLWYALAAPLWLLFIFPGWAAYGVITLWAIYRIVRGWLNFNENRPVYVE